MRYRIISITLVGLLVAGLVATTYLAARPPAEQPTVTLLYPQEPADGLLWPMNNSWVWSVNRMDHSAKGNSVSLVARVVRQRLKQGESLVVEPRIISKAESKAELAVGKLSGVGPAHSATVSVQIIDLGEAAAGAGKKRLRLLLHLRIEGSTISLNDEKTMIEGEYFAGQAPNKSRWTDGELHLQNLFVRDGDRVTIYDIVMVQSK